MDQVGQEKTFALVSAPVDPNIYAYVWHWWDGATEATTVPTTVKRLNIGGEPGTNELHYRCEPVLVDGQSTVIDGVVVDVNNPPTVFPPVTVSQNDAYFPYDTEIAVTAFDFDDHLLSFEWYDGGNSLGAGTVVGVGALDGTWTGNDTTVVGAYNGTRSTLALSGVAADKALRLYIWDTQNGTTTVDVALRGQAKPVPVVAGTAGAVSTLGGASTTPVIRIRPGAALNLTVYAKDPAGGTLTFLWLFDASNGWNADATAAGTTVDTADGGKQNSYSKDVSGETTGGATQKTVRAVVRITSTSTSGVVEIPFDAILVANASPTDLEFGAKVNGVDYSLASLVAVAAGSKVEFSATASDGNGDVLDYYWEFTQSVPPTSLRLWGARVVLDTVGYASGSTVQVRASAFDAQGASVGPITLPAIPIV